MSLSSSITSTGISAPTYNDILTSLQASYHSIFGSDAYLGNDSQDGQLLAVFAAAINDSNSALIQTYNTYSPAYAQGTGLDSMVKINGISRLVPSNSEATVTLVGQLGTIINNGVVRDISGNNWNLPTQVIIPASGTIDVTVIAQVPGAIVAPSGSINNIVTPTRGWQSAVSITDATLGSPVETDAELRQRQTISTSYPAVVVNQSITANVANTVGVLKSTLYENPTGSTDSNGVPGHSICVVAQGGNILDIANAIAVKKTPGTGTYGDTSQNVVIGNTLTTIHFQQAIPQNLTVTVTLTPKTNYTVASHTTIQNSLSTWVNSLQIGQTLEYTQALSQILGPTYKLESIAISVNGGGATTNTDVSCPFDGVFVLLASNVTITGD